MNMNNSFGEKDFIYDSYKSYLKSGITGALE